MTKGWVAAVLGLVACADDAPAPEMDQPCWIDTVIATELAGVTPLDCGHLDIGSDDARFIAAHDCAVAAHAAHAPFLVRWEIQGIDSHVVGAYLGRPKGGTWTITSFGYDSYAPGGAIRARTGSDTCADLVDRGACGIDLHQTLCLECAAPIASTYCPPR
ncbi:MAG: hypothetical protein K8W52_17205 [Deltaproteobacteria bacterium]|nr:hypothetical protein [Deltaproteobacteria bacterium]